MTNLLRRSQAPLTDRAWKEVDDLAGRVLRSQLSARRFVDVDGPHGWGLAAVDTGRLDLAGDTSEQDVPWGIRRVLPLVEVRIPFTLQQMELDAVSRGCRDPDLESLQKAANQAVMFEESVIYGGLPDANMQGMMPSGTRKSIKLPDDAERYPDCVAEALQGLESAGLPQPYVVVFGREPYFKLMREGEPGYPPHRLIEEMTDRRAYSSPALAGGVVLSAAEGHFELTLGQDWSVGYASHNRDEVELYLTESFAFRILEPAAIVELSPAG